MLNRAKLAQELARVSEMLFADHSSQYAYAQELWNKIVQDPLFLTRVRAVDAPWPVPVWDGQLNDIKPVSPAFHVYQVASVDGSQVYPDRHQGVSCFLINIGSVTLRYNGGPYPVYFDAVPTVFTELDPLLAGESVIEVVNGQRQLLELKGGLELSLDIKQKEPFTLLFDGSLIFWHLDSKTHQLQDHFLPQYLSVLLQLQKGSIINASYISNPKSKELVNLLRLQMCDFDLNKLPDDKQLEGIVDATIASFFLTSYQRTTVFKNRSSISEKYPESVRPYFFYLHVGAEIGRVEIPQWVAQDPALVDQVAQCILDQSIKGNGYPVALAEAHEQAVVKGPDRDFFYHLLNKLGFERSQRLRLSQKLIKKRGIGV